MPGPCGLIVIDPAAALEIIAAMAATNLFLPILVVVLLFARR